MRIALVISLIANAVLAVLLYLNVQVLEMVFGPARHERRQSQFALFEKPKGGTVFVGDSITHGGEWNELFERSDLYNRGIGGDTTTGLLARLDSIIALEPRKLFLMIGVNDLNAGEDQEDIVERYEQILERLARGSPRTRIFVQSVLPVSEDWIATENEPIESLNVELERLAGKYAFEFLDLHAAFEDENGVLRAELTNDGIHLMAPGYVLWRESIRELVEAPGPGWRGDGG